MKLRRIGVTAAASAIALGAIVAPNASAQALNPIKPIVDSMTCAQVDGFLKGANAYEADHATATTTRNELRENLNEKGSDVFGDLLMGLPLASVFQAQAVNTVADKALTCELVIQDPALGSSDFAGILNSLSSRAA